MPDDYRTTGERLAYLKAEIERLTGLYEQHDYLKESMEVCTAALQGRINQILEGKA